jgi:prefoldin alpha subunit
MKDDKQRELQGAIAQIELGRNRLEGLAGQIRLIETALSELSDTRKALEELSRGKDGASILVPVGSGSFVKAKVEDIKQVLVGVGAGVTVERKVSEAQEILNTREKEYNETLGKLRSAFTDLSSQVTELNKTAEGLWTELQARGGE